MAANRRRRRVEVEIDLQTLVSAIFRRIWLVGIVSVLSAILVFTGVYLFVSPKYQSYTVFYVNNSTKVGDSSGIEYGDLSASKRLVESYQIILLTRQTLEEIIDYSGLEMDYLELRKMISAKSMNGTEIIRVIVTAEDPEEAFALAKAIEYVLPNQISAMVEGSSAKVVDAAVKSTTRTGPDYSMGATVGFVVGALLTIGVIILRTLVDNRIRTEEDITRNCPHPVLAAVPNMNAASKGGYYGYGQDKKRGSERVGGMKRQQELFGPNISFAAAEAYKLLRTKILFSYADVQRCRVIGISSALAGEGKSLSAVNLAYSLSEIGKKVLLIDCDLRRPSVAAKLNIQREPGLSNYLTDQNALTDIIMPCGIPNEENAFYVMPAGPTPPNPVELLSSSRMRQMLNMLRKEYDYVLLDFPPVGEVSDALSFSKQTDGMLLVARQNYCDRKIFRNVIKQFHYMEARILGVVYNCASDGNGLYRKYYYKYRNSKSESSNQTNARQAKKAAKSK